MDQHQSANYHVEIRECGEIVLRTHVERDVREPGGLGTMPGDTNGLRSEVDADDSASGSHPLGCQESHVARTTPDVEDGLAFGHANGVQHAIRQRSHQLRLNALTPHLVVGMAKSIILERHG